LLAGRYGGGIIKEVASLTLDVRISLSMKKLALILVIIGGLNWGLVGLLGFDLVATLFGTMSMISKVVYVLVGLSAVYMLFTSFGKKM
jgi:uncharacterized membrane protein YuzA (DUF378 family)